MNIEFDVIVTKQMIDELSVGDMLPNCFGQFAEVTSIHGKGISYKDGKAYACFYQQFGENSTMSHSITEGEKIWIFFGKHKNSK